MFISQKHPFHILDASPFPFLVSFFLCCFLPPLTFYMHGLDFFSLPRADIMHLAFIGLYVTVMSGFISIIKESSEGFHTRKVQKGLRLGMVLFILSEVMFFFAFFGAFFHYSLVPSAAIGGIGPPYGTQEISPGGLPLVNTLLLLASGVTITIAHAYIVHNNAEGFYGYLFLTIVLGLTFLFCQGYEYTYGVKFSGRENIYGSIFFITTGFHGLHVTIGTLFLLFCACRHLFATLLPMGAKEDMTPDAFARTTSGKAEDMSLLGHMIVSGKYGSFTPDHHFGFEAAAGYGHFVDVVGLFLFITIYGGGGV